MNTRPKSNLARSSAPAFVIQVAIILTLRAQSPSADSFDPSPSNGSGGTSVSALAVQPDGKIIVGGQFSKIGGLARTNSARLYQDGTVEIS